MGSKQPTPAPALVQPILVSPPPPPKRPPHRYPPRLQSLIDECVFSPSRAGIFTADEIDAVFDAGVMVGVRESTSLGVAVAWFLTGAITWGVIGFAAGWAVFAP
jgi:hypothetical protein